MKKLIINFGTVFVRIFIKHYVAQVLVYFFLLFHNIKALNLLHLASKGHYIFFLLVISSLPHSQGQVAWCTYGTNTNFSFLLIFVDNSLERV